MRAYVSVIVLVTTFVMLGACSSTPVSEDHPLGERGQTLEEEEEIADADCETVCQEEFHACRESDDRGGGPGASGCAHERNDCKASC